jgi:hypothetical protein
MVVVMVVSPPITERDLYGKCDRGAAPIEMSAVSVPAQWIAGPDPVAGAAVRAESPIPTVRRVLVVVGVLTDLPIERNGFNSGNCSAGFGSDSWQPGGAVVEHAHGGEGGLALLACRRQV